MTDYLSNESAKLIRTIASTPSANPFFLTLAYNAPHNPLQALKSDFEDPALASIPSHNGRVYAAMIKALDRGVGQVLEALKDTNQWNNTIVVFTSDNGGASYIDLPLINHPYRGWKATFFEGGLRVPLFMQWPAMIDASTEVTQTVSHVDIFPTLFAAAAMMNASSSSSSPESCSEKQQVESAYSKGFFSSFFTFSSPPETNQTLSEMPSYQALITQSEFDGNVQLTALRVIHHVEAAFSSLQIRWEPTLASLNAKIHRVIEIIDSFLARLLTTISVSRPKATTDEYERNESFSNNISSNEDDSNTATAEIESVNGSSDSGSDITRSRAWWPRLLRRMSTDGFCGLVVKEWFCPASVDYDSRTTTAGAVTAMLIVSTLFVSFFTLSVLLSL